MDRKCGFTLVEISVVLVIIGLIVGGIVIGRDVINNAQMQTIISDVARFKNAAKQFQEKYKYLPGDLPTATTYWGADSGCPTGAVSNAPRTETCNGNGDGKVRSLNVNSYYTSPQFLGDFNYESLRFWQHLANAGFTEGLYSGVGYSGNYHPGINIPMSKANDNSGFIFFYSDPVTAAYAGPGGAAAAASYPGNYGNIIEYGGNLASAATTAALNQTLGLTTAQAMGIDKKTDDGMPSTGNVLSFTTNGSGNPNCNDASVPPAYKTSNVDVVCSLIFLTGL